MEPRDKQSGLMGRLGPDPKPSRRLRAPLFDRLTMPAESEKHRPEPFRSLELDEAIESVRRELQRLLNTRTRPGWSTSPGQTLTAIDYGLPDFSHIAAADPLARNDLALLISRTIESFEPRLKQVHVTLAPHPTSQRVLTGSIQGAVVLGVTEQPVCFDFEVHATEGSAAVQLQTMAHTA